MQSKEEILNKAYTTMSNITNTLYILYRFCEYYKSDEVMLYLLPFINYIKKDADNTYCEMFYFFEGIEE